MQETLTAFIWTVALIIIVSLVYVIGRDQGWTLGSPYAGQQAEMEARCLNQIEDRAAHRFKWTARTNAGRFNIKRDKYAAGQIGTLEGDELELMNGYGAWFKYRYRCWLSDDGDPAPEIWKVTG